MRGGGRAVTRVFALCIPVNTRLISPISKKSRPVHLAWPTMHAPSTSLRHQRTHPSVRMYDQVRLHRSKRATNTNTVTTSTLPPPHTMCEMTYCLHCGRCVRNDGRWWNGVDEPVWRKNFCSIDCAWTPILLDNDRIEALEQQQQPKQQHLQRQRQRRRHRSKRRPCRGLKAAQLDLEHDSVAVEECFDAAEEAVAGAEAAVKKRQSPLPTNTPQSFATAWSTMFQPIHQLVG